MKVQPDTLTERPTKRADARRNHDRILAAARAAFEDPDASPSMAEIARRAGVGMATLYRNFPTRLELLEALYATEADVAFTTTDIAPDATPGQALRTWLTQFFTFAANKKNIAAELLTHIDRDSPIFDDTKTRVVTNGRPLFDAAQAAQQIQHDLSIEQVLQMLVSIAAIDGGPGSQEPLLRTVLDGLAPPPAADSANDAGLRRGRTGRPRQPRNPLDIDGLLKRNRDR